jgi:hypothetical protein
MAQEITKVAEALFEKIRSRFGTLNLGNDKAEATSDPTEARFFNFDYVSSQDSKKENFGNITISIIDNTSLKIYFSKNISDKLDAAQLKEWFDFLQEMRRFARRNLMTFDTRDITRSNLSFKDIRQAAAGDGTYKSGDVKVTESKLYGTTKHSFENIGTARLRIVHTESVNTEVRGSRARHINAIYVENAQGERFKMESNKLSGARAMARHISEGGTPYDEVGQQIKTMVQEMTELGRFVRSMRSRVFEDSVTTTMVEAAVSYYNNMHRQLNALRGQRNYTAFVEAFEPQAQQLDEMDVNEIKERFVKKIFDDRMTAALPHVYKAYRMFEQTKQDQIDAVKSIIEGQSTLALVANEGMDEYMKMLRFQDTGALVSQVLEDIANRAETMPEVAEFANYWANHYNSLQENQEQSQGKALAVQLATHYLKDLRHIKENFDLRYTSEFDLAEELDVNNQLIGEGTWAMPKTPEDLQALQQLLAKPIPYGMDAQNVTSTIGNLLGNDELFDRLTDLVDQVGEEADAVPAITDWIKDNYPGMYERLGLGNEELDQPPAQPTQPPPPENTTAADTPPGQNSGGVVSEDLMKMLRIAGLRR